MATIVESVSNLRGGALLSVLAKLKLNGDPAVTAAVQFTLLKVGGGSIQFIEGVGEFSSI